MNSQKVRIQLIRRNLRLKDLAGLTGIDYDRLQKILHGYRDARPDELRQIACVLEMDPEDLAEPAKASPQAL